MGINMVDKAVALNDKIKSLERIKDGLYNTDRIGIYSYSSVAGYSIDLGKYKLGDKLAAKVQDEFTQYLLDILNNKQPNQL